MMKWTELIEFLHDSASIDPNIFGVQSNIAGGKLKETGLALWDPPNVGATNESAFSAIPTGWRNTNGTYQNLGKSGGWWSSTSVENSHQGINRNFGGASTDVGRNNPDKGLGIAVRCKKDK